ncbi:hypothetical protein [Sporosarcina sp. P30]|uniref:hypothetical protein n=1 Tax=unclassified Sporosarcina TaxID=2647733 RepID=UPI0035180CD9
MSNCAIDHTQQDVIEKLAEQQSFMPEELVRNCELFLSKPLSQETLNESRDIERGISFVEKI